ncbi:SRPBCC domain-containing protein [Galactobacter valiniphilus]|uniref:SRPBCC domain-containing protein n=1 Tax=Galactobacter valiniphilus TaxID=2676122 RepID=UPI0037351ED5
MSATLPTNEIPDDADALRVRAVLSAPVERVWDFVTEPGWFINDGQWRDHRVQTPSPGRHLVIDPVYGEFEFDDVEVVPLVRYVSKGAHTGGDTAAPATITSFELTEVEGGTELIITETGFAGLGLGEADTRAAIDANVGAWVRELDLAGRQLS